MKTKLAEVVEKALSGGFYEPYEDFKVVDERGVLRVYFKQAGIWGDEIGGSAYSVSDLFFNHDFQDAFFPPPKRMFGDKYIQDYRSELVDIESDTDRIAYLFDQIKERG